MKKRFPLTLPNGLLQHYKAIGFTSKADFLETFRLQQQEGIHCDYCRSIASFLGVL